MRNLVHKYANRRIKKSLRMSELLHEKKAFGAGLQEDKFFKEQHLKIYLASASDKKLCQPKK